MYSNKNILFKVRAYLILGFISIFSFYYIMTAANPSGVDDIFVRSIVGIILIFKGLGWVNIKNYLQTKNHF